MLAKLHHSLQGGQVFSVRTHKSGAFSEMIISGFYEFTQEKKKKIQKQTKGSIIRK
ncbi:hypothetical protein [Butyricicoccus faecihominis]|uniref:hypothetical protein n=1 Tax=Butyricicoccus faecihominis TaxID=1712515 RepID=UPI00247A27D9|nr:hypothetical protein [Butyricicoccus faecihominis]